MAEKIKILVVDDDASLREALCDTLELAGYQVHGCENGQQAITVLLSDDDYGLVLSDVQMAPIDGIELLQSICAANLDVPVVMMSAYGTVPKAVEAMRLGAVDYLVKPFEMPLLEEKLACYARPSKAKITGDFVAAAPKMQELLGKARRVAQKDVVVMISGESGCGKEVMSRFIHANSKRSDKPFVAINCAAIPDNMLEAVMFGYEKGAFTGAYKSTPGKFEQAQGGTLLLDEISEMDIGLQAKLLRVIQEQEVERLGGRETIKLDVRILATTNRALKAEIEKGTFREDLYFRLSVFPLVLPSLRERKEDIPHLAEVLLDKHAQKEGTIRRFGVDARTLLMSYDWPGNVRELDNVIQRALIMTDDEEIGADAIMLENAERAPASKEPTAHLETDLKGREQQMILDALHAANGSRKITAEVLGISARTLRHKLARMREAGVEIPPAPGGAVSL